MRILFVCHEYPPAQHGGIGIVIQTLAESLVARGFGVSIIGQYSGVAGQNTEICKGVTVHRLPCSGAGMFGKLSDKLVLWRKVEALVQDEHIDVIEYHDFHADLWRRHSVPTVLRLHGGNAFYSRWKRAERQRHAWWMERRAFGCADHVVGVSRFVLDGTLEALNLSRTSAMSVIYNCVDDIRFMVEPGKDTPPRVVYVGTLNPFKGVLELAQAANRFLATTPEAELHYVGRDLGTNATSVAAQIRETVRPELRSRVVIHDPVPHDVVPEVLRSARIFAFFSPMEAFPLAPLEAMASGCTVVASNAGPMPEMIEDGVTGCLVKTGDIDALAHRIESLLCDPQRCQRIGQAARDRVNQCFSLGRIISENIQLYEKLAGKPNTASEGVTP